jgi:hypothetical protein
MVVISTHSRSWEEQLGPACATIAAWMERINWSAFEAIGTVGALWFAMVQSTRSQRVERLKAVGILTALVGLIEPITEAVPVFEERESGVLNSEEINFLVQARPLVLRAQEGLKAISFMDAAIVEASEYVSALPLALAEIDEISLAAQAGKVATHWVNMTNLYPAEACEFFRNRRDYIKYGLLGSKFRSIVRDLSIKWWVWRAAITRPRDKTKPAPPARAVARGRTRRGWR